MRVKKLVKVGLSEGGGVQPDFRLKRGGGGGGGGGGAPGGGGGGGGGGAYHECYCEKNILC